MSTTMIHPVQDDELVGVAQLRWQWFREVRGTPATTQEEFTESFVAWAQANRSSHRCLVLVEDAVVIGMAWLAIYQRVPSVGTSQRLSGDVQSVYVVPDRRDSGLGSELIDAVVRLADELGLQPLTVNSSTKAVNAYIRRGFVTSPELLKAEFVR
ncbi:GNAT family N-acetyltransferase [Nocardia sp. NPDC046473]|uniref:GNAT family N-acetyltransferase n=1 Tax=Nocardia sp. NPDC046473 TaxID=3155733 RepID=UPI0033FF08FE